MTWISRIKEPVDLYSIADVVEKNYEFCHSATRVSVSLFSFFLFFSFFFFFTFLDSRDRLDRTLEDCLCRRFDGSSSVCVSNNFFPLSTFLVLFRGWHDILKEIEESSNFFSIYVGRDNFVISLPSSTAHFNWIPYEFSVLLGSCLFIKLQQLLTYFLLTHSEPHTLTLSSGSFFLKTLR